MGLHADDFHVGAHRFDVVGHAGNQAATANGHEHRVQWPLVLTQHFHRDRALASDHFRVVKRMNEGQTLSLAQFDRVRIGIRITVTKQHHIAAQGFDRIYFERRSGDRHDDDRPSPEFLRAQCHPLCMVASRSADHAFFQLTGRQLHHFVVGAAKFEAEHRLLVFAFEQNLVFEFFAQHGRHIQRRLVRHVIHLGGQDFFQIISGRELAFAAWASII